MKLLQIQYDKNCIPEERIKGFSWVDGWEIQRSGGFITSWTHRGKITFLVPFFKIYLSSGINTSKTAQMIFERMTRGPVVTIVELNMKTDFNVNQKELLYALTKVKLFQMSWKLSVNKYMYISVTQIQI